MPRVTKSATAKQSTKVLSSTKGHYGAEVGYIRPLNNQILNLYNMLLETEKIKRNMRSLWISRINAASREHGISYSKFINNLSSKNIILIEKFYLRLQLRIPLHLKK